MSMLQYSNLISLDLKNYLRKPSRILMPLFFFLMVCSIFPIALGPNQKTLTLLAPSIIWVGVLLSIILSLETFFQNEYDEGTLEQLMFSPLSLSILLFIKTFAHWLVTGFLLVLFSPFLGILFNLSFHQNLVLNISLILGTPILSLMTALVSILTLGLNKNWALLIICVLPLVIPVLILGTSSVQFAHLGLLWSSHIALLAALFVLAVLLVPFAMAFALRESIAQL